MICIFIDALNPAYLKYMPYLNELKKRSLSGELEIPMAFTGISASFFTGLNPENHKIVDLFRLSNKKEKIYGKYITNLLRWVKGKRFFYTPLAIEKEKASFFRTCINKIWYQKDSIKEKTLFDILEENNKTFEIIDWPHHFKNRKAKLFLSKSDKTAFNKAKKAILRDTDFIFVHFLGLEIAHQTGIGSEEAKNKALEIDIYVKELVESYKEDVLIFSDHNMNDIKNEIDIEKEISKLNLEFGKDFVYFIGSTMARFWFKNKESRKKVVKICKKIKKARIIKEKDFNLPRVADLILLTDTKSVFWPNFFLRKEHFKAMHGWNPKEKDNKTIYLLKSNLAKTRKKNARMIDMLPTILQMMNIPKSECDGKSLF